MVEYRTQNLYEASFLMARGIKLKGKETVSDKVTVIFEGVDDIGREAVKFYNGERIEAKKYSDCYRSLKDYIFKR